MNKQQFIEESLTHIWRDYRKLNLALSRQGGLATKILMIIFLH